MSKKTSFFIFQALLIIIGFSVSVLYTPDTLKNLNGFQLSKRLITYTPAAEYTVQDSITASGSEEAPAPDGFGPGVLFGIALLVAFLAAVAVIPLAYFNPGPARMAAILSGVIFIIIIFVLTIIPKDIGIYFGLEEKNISFFSLLSIFRQGAYLIAAAMIFSIFGVFSPGEDFDKQPLKGNVK
ncbi:MAG TPA: hypothetical protein VKS21_05480, partial [Spirochaetota bacterium]|nr:hypothetical protein [Spirochaetota bacterium]